MSTTASADAASRGSASTPMIKAATTAAASSDTSIGNGSLPSSAQPPLASASLTFAALDALVAMIEQGDSIDAGECAQWAGVCESLLSRVENLRLVVRTKCTPEALRTLTQNSGNAPLARAMSLGGSTSSLLRSVDKFSSLAPAAFARGSPSRSWTRALTVAPPVDDEEQEREWEAEQAAKKAAVDATNLAAARVHASSIPPAPPEPVPDEYKMYASPPTSPTRGSGARGLARSISFDAMLNNGIIDLEVKPRVDCWQRRRTPDGAPMVRPIAPRRLAAARAASAGRLKKGPINPKDLMLMGGGGGGQASLNKAASTSSMDAIARARAARAGGAVS